MLIIVIQHTTLLMESLDSKVENNANFIYGGGKGEDAEGRVKEHNLWNDDWNE